MPALAPLPFSSLGWGAPGAAEEAEPGPLQVDAKATLGLGGVAVVLGAVTAAMGLFSYLGVPSSLVILQVVPFLVLAVGADNIFIFVLEYQVRGWGSPLLADVVLHWFGPFPLSPSPPAFVSTVPCKTECPVSCTYHVCSYFVCHLTLC